MLWTLFLLSRNKEKIASAVVQSSPDCQSMIDMSADGFVESTPCTSAVDCASLKSSRSGLRVILINRKRCARFAYIIMSCAPRVVAYVAKFEPKHWHIELILRGYYALVAKPGQFVEGLGFMQ